MSKLNPDFLSFYNKSKKQKVIAEKRDPLLGKLIDSLNEDEREVFILREYAFINFREIASLTNVSISTASKRYERSLAKITKEILKERSDESHKTPSNNEISLNSDNYLISLIKHLTLDFEYIYSLPSYKFEELIAKLLENLNYNVKLTSKTRDGGKDIIAVQQTPLGELITYVECKLYNADNPVSVNVVRSLYGTIQKDRVNHGSIITTSFFTRDAIKEKSELKNLISLNDKKDLKELLLNFGNPT